MAAILTERVWPPPSLRKSENKNEPEKADMNHGGFFVVFSLIYQTKVQQYKQGLYIVSYMVEKLLAFKNRFSVLLLFF